MALEGSTLDVNAERKRKRSSSNDSCSSKRKKRMDSNENRGPDVVSNKPETPTKQESQRKPDFLTSGHVALVNDRLNTEDLNTVIPANPTSGNICALTNSSGTNVEMVHLVPKDASSELITDLEDAWGMGRHSLDVDDPGNLLPLMADFCKSFEAGHWALVPTDLDMVAQMRDLAYGRECEGIETVYDIYKAHSETKFPYAMIPLTGFKSIIKRHEDTNPTTCVDYEYPYEGFPQLTLPIYPHFVILDLGTKLERMSRQELETVFDWIGDYNINISTQYFFSRDAHKYWFPTKKFDNDYPDLPRLDKKLNRLVHQDDSFSRVSTAYTDNTDSDDGSYWKSEGGNVNSGEFEESPRSFCIRIMDWARHVSYTLRHHPSPDSTSLSPSPTGKRGCKAENSESLERILDNDYLEEIDRSISDRLANVCALTNVRGDDVEFAHLVPRNASADMIEDLEDSWGMKNKTLDINDFCNLLPLNQKLRQSFEAGHWALVPTDREIAGGLSGFATGDDCEGINTVFDIYHGKTAFSYELLPIPGFGDAINRFETLDSTAAVVHCHPYENFPQLTLPIYPHLATINLGMKLAQLGEAENELISDWVGDHKVEMYSQFILAKGTYELWQPTKEFDDEYAPLPRVDKDLDRLIHPADSFSCILCSADDFFSENNSILNDNTDDHPDNKSSVDSAPSEKSFGPKEFQESYLHFAGRMMHWKWSVYYALERCPDAPSPASVALPPSPPSLPLSLPSPKLSAASAGHSSRRS